MIMDTFPALMYGALIIGVIFIGTAFFVSDFTSNYPGTNMNNALDSQSVQEVNSSINTLNQTIAQATASITAPTQTQDLFTAAFGYLTGVFTGIVGLVQGTLQIPHLMGGLATSLTKNLSVFYPTWFGVFITVAIAIMGAIYLIYILTKVK
jgi:hypothetical protein